MGIQNLFNFLLLLLEKIKIIPIENTERQQKKMGESSGVRMPMLVILNIAPTSSFAPFAK